MLRKRTCIKGKKTATSKVRTKNLTKSKYKILQKGSKQTNTKIVISYL